MTKLFSICCVLLMACVVFAGIAQAEPSTNIIITQPPQYHSVVWLTPEGQVYLDYLSSKYVHEPSGVRTSLIDRELSDYHRLQKIASSQYISVPGDGQYRRLVFHGYVLDCYTGWTKYDAERAAKFRAYDQWESFWASPKATKLAGGIQVVCNSDGSVTIYSSCAPKVVKGAYDLPKLVWPPTMADVCPPRVSLVNSRIIITQSYATGGSHTVSIKLPCK